MTAGTQEAHAAPATVRSRTVWYFHGFDPAAVARYRRIFGAASARLGVAVDDLPDKAEGWRAVRGGTVTDVRLLRYEDLVRAWRAPPLRRRLARYLGALGGYWLSGAMWRIGQRAPRAPNLAAAPFLALVLPAGLAWGIIGGWNLLVGLIGAVLALTGSLWLMRRLFLDVIADLFAWMRAFACGQPGVADCYLARVEALAGSIAADCDADADEVLVVGHSLGGIAAVLAVAEVVERVGREAAAPPAASEGHGTALGLGRIALLTLGSTHGIVLAQPGPGRERVASAIARVAAGGVFWVDVSSPRDAFCVPLTDPLLMIAGRARPGMVSPRVISALLGRAPRIPGDRRTVFGAMRRHMGYLLAPEPGSGFDYADAVTGALSLRERFGGRGNSPRARMWQP